MNIYVLLKRTFDTEEKITVSQGQIDEDSAEWIINPYDEYAVEEAVRLRDDHGGSVTVVTVGTDESDEQLRKALAMGADQAVLINIEDNIETGDAHTTAALLTAYLSNQEPDLILAGNVAIDGGSGQVGPRVAEGLGIAHVTTITSIEVNGQNVTIERDVEGDTETIQTTLPLLVTCQQGLNEPRYPSLPGIMKAKKKPLDELEPDDLEISEDEAAPQTKQLAVFLPPDKAAGRILEGELADQVKELASLLHHEAKVV